MTTVLLTRPEGENESLAALLAGHEADILIRPLIELSAIKVTPEAKQCVMNIDQHDVVIFVSKSSVRYALPLLENYWPQWPLAPRWLAVGPGTAGALAGFGIQAAYPRIAGSGGLLELPALRFVSGGKVLIVRGVGGRELLASELTRRGAEVSYLEVYQRSPATGADWTNIPPGSVAVLTSLEALVNLRSQLGDDIYQYRVVVASSRIAAEANGFAQTIIAAGASDQALYDAILRCL